MSDEESPQGEIHSRMACIIQEVGHIGKDQKNQSQGFHFRGIDDIYDALHPIMAKHGVVVLPELLENTIADRPTRNGGVQYHHTVRVRYHFSASDGSSVSCCVPGEAMDTQDKGLSKAMSVALKYAMFQTFLIPVRGVTPDPDADSPEETTQPMASEEQKHAIEELFTKLGHDADRQSAGIKWAGGDPVNGVNGLTFNQANKLIGTLNKAK